MKKMYNFKRMNIFNEAKAFLSEAEVLSDKMRMDFERDQSVLIVKKSEEIDTPQGFYLGEIEHNGNIYVLLGVDTPK